MLLVASILVLFLLSSFAIRSNLDTRMLEANRGHVNRNATKRVSRRNRWPVPSKKRTSTNSPGHFELVETSYEEEMTSEGPRPDLLESAPRNDASNSEPVIAKLIVVEIFKAGSFHLF